MPLPLVSQRQVTGIYDQSFLMGEILKTVNDAKIVSSTVATTPATLVGISFPKAGR